MKRAAVPDLGGAVLLLVGYEPSCDYAVAKVSKLTLWRIDAPFLWRKESGGSDAK